MFSGFGLKPLASGFQSYSYSSLKISPSIQHLFIINLDVLSIVLYRRRNLEATVKIKLKTSSKRLKSKS